MTELDDNIQPVSLTLAPYTGLWTREHAAHLLRRTLYGPTFPQIQQALTLGMQATVDQLLTLPTTEPPLTFSADDGVSAIGETWVDKVYPAAAQTAESTRRLSLFAWLMSRINQGEFSIQEKMSLFWQNHFAAQFAFDSRASYTYFELLRSSCLGNFRQLVKDITIDPCMLVFLNGASNNKFSPNENYSRELLELYSIGKGPQVGDGDYTNYTEQDVAAGAKILTGWTIQNFLSTTVNTTSSAFVSTLHSGGPKTLSNRFGNAVVNSAGATEYKNYIDVIFQQTETAKFICRKIYRWFVNYDLTSEVESTVINDMANTLITNNYELLPVLRELLCSQHFYDLSVRGAIIKNPMEYAFSMYNSSLSKPTYSLPINTELYYNLYFIIGALGMEYAKPPSVGGWTAYYQAPSYTRLWANSSLVKLRFDLSDNANALGGINIQGNRWGVDHIALLNSLSMPDSAEDVIEDLVLLFCTKGLSDAYKMQLKALLTNGLPDFEWTLQYNEYLADPTNPDTINPIKSRMTVTLASIFKSADFQLI